MQMRHQFERELSFIHEVLAGFCLDQSGYSPACIPDNLDWRYIMERGSEHHVLPILNSILRPIHTDLPADVADRLESAYRATLGRNLACISWTDDFVGRCRAAGIPVILLKGSSYCRHLYRDAGLRFFSDIDLLVPADKVRDAATILESTGMRIEPGNRLDELLRIYNHATYEAAESSVGSMALKVELHWAFHESSTPARFDMDRIWRDALPEGSHLRLSLEDELIFGSHHLCEHLFFNASPALLWICDLALRLESGVRVDWATFIDKNEAYGTSEASAVAQTVLERVLSVRRADDIAAWTEERVPDGIRGLLDRLTAGDVVEERLVRRRAERLAAQLALNPKAGSKLSFLCSRCRENLGILLGRRQGIGT